MEDFYLNMEDFDLATINMKDFEFSSYLNSPEDKENNATQPSSPEVNNSRFPSFQGFVEDYFHPSFVNMKMGQNPSNFQKIRPKQEAAAFVWREELRTK